MNRILLVDDQPPQASHFRLLFGHMFDHVDVCRTHDEVVQALGEGTRWTAAFVDFDLSGISEPQRSGLSVLRLLLENRPETRRVAYTTLNENGRTLYAVAARHWLKTKIILGKESGEREIIAAANPDGPNPTPPAWEDKLNFAFLIDDLFAQYRWLSLWQIWSFYYGSIKAVGDHAPPGNNPTSIRQFSVDAANAVENFRCAFEGPKRISYERKNYSARATPLVAFADANSKFFSSPDLQEILDFAKPWDRVRARTRG